MGVVSTPSKVAQEDPVVKTSLFRTAFTYNTRFGFYYYFILKYYWECIGSKEQTILSDSEMVSVTQG